MPSKLGYCIWTSVQAHTSMATTKSSLAVTGGGSMDTHIGCGWVDFTSQPPASCFRSTHGTLYSLDGRVWCRHHYMMALKDRMKGGGVPEEFFPYDLRARKGD